MWHRTLWWVLLRPESRLRLEVSWFGRPGKGGVDGPSPRDCFQLLISVLKELLGGPPPTVKGNALKMVVR